ncbi:MAG: hypothetical protein ABH858_05195 [Candidatus Omnitrophota bacterium]
MALKMMRRKYLVHPSIQFKYIAMSVFPALMITLFSTYFLIKSGELSLEAEKGRMSAEISSLDYIVRQLEVNPNLQLKKETIDILKKRLLILQETLKIRHFSSLEIWAKTKIQIFIALFSTLTIVAMLALLFSHRIVGPLVRLRRCLESLSQGKDTPPLRFRDYDEFKELAVSFEKLREKLKERGMI